ncbi:MAG: hypothetical protein POELPBGB_02671 [Bacteroidia bacterium]|nr:hypothetical protein [Bacteroidia bacterium]
MTVIIRKKDTPSQIKEKVSRVMKTSVKKRKNKNFDAMKYLGKGIFGDTDGLTYQKKVRDEWE